MSIRKSLSDASLRSFQKRDKRSGPAAARLVAVVFVVGLFACASRLYAQKQQQQKKLKRVPIFVASSWPDDPEAPDVEAPSFSEMSHDGECRVQDEHVHVSYSGDVIKTGAGEKGLTTDTAMGCCRECKATLGCNLWVYCSDSQQCGQQCWLKRVGDLGGISGVTTRERGWTSGILYKDFDRDVASLPAIDLNLNIVALRTDHGAIRIQLKSEWSEPSVDYLRRLAATPELCTASCQFYRAEEGFLLQGSMRAFIPPNSAKQTGPKLMERGDVGWANGGAGPDFFVYLGKEPAKHFGQDNTVFGVVADEESLKVADQIAAMHAEASQPEGMHMLSEPQAFKFEIPAAA